MPSSCRPLLHSAKHVLSTGSFCLVAVATALFGDPDSLVHAYMHACSKRSGMHTDVHEHVPPSYAPQMTDAYAAIPVSATLPLPPLHIYCEVMAMLRLLLL